MVLYFIAGLFLFSRKNYAKFYVIAYSIPLLFAIDYYIINKIGVSFLNTEAIHLKIATLIEILLITFAIMYRMRAVKEENELRQTEMRIFLKRQDMMSRDNVEKIIQDVYLENLIMQYDLDGLEIKLLQYISEGKPNEKIVRKLKLTEHELERCTKELYEKLEISEHIQEDYRMVNKQPDYIYN
jgi:DNA-binding CsgD family transcriptional regulator